MSIAPGHKWCKGCNQELPNDKFSIDRKQQDGLFYRCKKCTSAMRKSRKGAGGIVEDCKWCNRRISGVKGGYCSKACRTTRDRMMRKYPDRPIKEGVNPEGFINFVGGFFDELRICLGEGKPEALGFVIGFRGQYEEWCDLLCVPDQDALSKHLFAQWKVPYFTYDRVVPPPAPPPARGGKQDAHCPACGETDPEMFNREGHGYRTYCRECGARRLREHRARRKMGVVR